MNKDPLLSVCIVSYNAPDYINKCLLSIYNSIEKITFEVIVIDNNSSEETQRVYQKYPKIILHRNKDNILFAKANNQAFSLSHGEYLLLLNPDTEISSGFFTSIVTFLKNRADIGIVGCRLLNSDGSLQSSIGNYPTIRNIIEEYGYIYLLKRLLLKQKLLKNHEYSHRVETLLGACLLTKRDIINTIGPLDEYFSMYMEEVDWEYRISAAGYAVYYWAEGQIYHHSGKSANQSPYRRIASLEENMKSQYRYFRKHATKIEAMGVRIIISASILTRFLLRSIIYLIESTDKRSITKEKIRSYKRLLRWMWFNSKNERWSQYSFYHPNNK